MFDIKWIRDNPEAFDNGLEARGIARGGEIKFSDELLALDEERRAHLVKLQEAQARRNAASKEIGVVVMEPLRGGWSGRHGKPLGLRTEPHDRRGDPGRR